MINQDTINAMFDEILALRRANTVLLDRLHRCKRDNRESKIELRNYIERLSKPRLPW